MLAAERGDYGDVILSERLRDALARLNPGVPTEALDHAIRKLTGPRGAELIQRNRTVHRFLVNGVTVEYRTGVGHIRNVQAVDIGFNTPTNNDWLEPK